MNTYAVRFFGMVVIVVLALAPDARADAPTGRFTVVSRTVYDTKTKLTWQQAVPAMTYTWSNAKTYCAGMASTLGGAGWRLPTRNELLTIVDYSRSKTAIDPIAFPGTTVDFFWSASLLNGSSHAFGVNFDYGHSHSADVSHTYSVRCVR